MIITRFGERHMLYVRKPCSGERSNPSFFDSSFFDSRETPEVQPETLSSAVEDGLQSSLHVASVVGGFWAIR